MHPAEGTCPEVRCLGPRHRGWKAHKDPSLDRRQGKRYLVFRFWAGLSNRRQELVGMVGAARLLNRTLVLPPLVENRWMANHEEDR